MNVGPVHAPPWQNGPGQDRTAAHQGPVRPCVTGGLTGDRSARKPPEDQRLPTIRCAEGPALSRDRLMLVVARLISAHRGHPCPPEVRMETTAATGSLPGTATARTGPRRV